MIWGYPYFWKHPYILRPILNMSKSLFLLLMTSVFFPASWKKNNFCQVPRTPLAKPIPKPQKKPTANRTVQNHSQPDSRFRVWVFFCPLKAENFSGFFPKVPSNSSLSRPPLRSSSYFLVGMARNGIQKYATTKRRFLHPRFSEERLVSLSHHPKNEKERRI